MWLHRKLSAKIQIKCIIDPASSFTGNYKSNIQLQPGGLCTQNLRYIRKENLFFTVWEFGPIVPPIWSDQATTGTSRELVLPPPPALAELSSSSPSVSCNGSISTSSGRICAIQAFWDIIHPQLLSLLQLFHSNGLYVWRLTQASITLLPKKKDANTVEDFRPISIISRFIKIVSKKRNKHCL